MAFRDAKIRTIENLIVRNLAQWSSGHQHADKTWDETLFYFILKPTLTLITKGVLKEGYKVMLNWICHQLVDELAQ